MLILLKDANNNFLGSTTTDVDGNYTFNNIANGTYNIYPEALNYATTQATNISVNNGQVNNINFKQHTIAMTITPNTTGISPVASDESVQVYPNPTSGITHLQWLQHTAQAAHVVVTDIVGRGVYTTDMTLTAGEGTAQLDLSSLKTGLYTISIRSANVSYTQKISVER
jgi:hypothetical protein